ncbi:hypothetical protein [Alteribacter populi]|uniref:hypothetical protein n=1 Tax=Alteribacter populi TaxID=2011011 RepID=UPI000BBA9629|nr:hypothetical protein [Alteribacter populi]
MMRHGHGQQNKINQANNYMGVDLHRFSEQEGERTNIELASEFGLSLHDVKMLKKKLDRN